MVQKKVFLPGPIQTDAALNVWHYATLQDMWCNVMELQGFYIFIQRNSAVKHPPSSFWLAIKTLKNMKIRNCNSKNETFFFKTIHPFYLILNIKRFSQTQDVSLPVLNWFFKWSRWSMFVRQHARFHWVCAFQADCLVRVGVSKGPTITKNHDI